MNGAPDWQDGDCCFRCRTQFSLVARKHHCRNCGNIFCAKCSAQQIPIPRLNIDKSVRVCDGCYEKISSKSEDPLTLALNDEERANLAKSAKATSSSTKSTTSSSSSTSNRKSAANASAPSEQELKEEEELQLALALSLSEAPTKVSFPDCRQFEEPVAAPAAPVAPAPATVAPIPETSSATTVTNNIHTSPVMTDKTVNQNSQQQTIPVHAQQQQPYEYNILDRDREVFSYVAETQSTLEIFNNRLNACKLRNRPITNDSAIQSIFLKLNTETQPKLSEFIRAYEEERAGYERLQDKLSQIADARAALDALREEHQEKMRQLAAEAEKQRQSQLASKLEAMRQKKSQMMQYQRDLALQRIREQEMMLEQPQQQQQAPPLPPATLTTIPNQQQLPPQQQYSTLSNPFNSQQLANALSNPAAMGSPSNLQQSTSYQDLNHGAIQNHHLPPQVSTGQPQIHQDQTQSFHSYVPAPQPPPVPDYASLTRFEQQYLPKPPKPEEDTPLISFDD